MWSAAGVQADAALLAGGLRRGARWAAADAEGAALLAAARSLARGRERGRDPLPLLRPFLDVVRSERTGAAVTGQALAVLHKLLTLGLLDPTHPSLPATVQSIADAVTHARFISTDHSSDGVVLMKILQVLRTLILSPEGALLTGDAVCEIMLSCFRICFETRLNELLRHNAEQCLRDMIQHVFLRLSQFSSSANIENDGFGYDKGNFTLREQADSLKNYKLNSEDATESNFMQENFAIPVDAGSSPSIETELSTLISTVQDIEGKTDVVDDDIIPSNSEISETSAESPKTNSKSPIKKHGRHSSMDLASNDNIYITQLVEKCIIPSDNREGDLMLSEEKIVSSLEDPISATVQTLNENVNEIIPEETVDNTIANVEDFDSDKEFINPRGVRFTSYDEHANLLPYGIPCIKELFRFLISLCNPLDSQNNSSMVYLGLSLIQTVLEVSSDHLAKHPVLLQLIKDPLCRNLLSLLNTERVAIFALDLQVSFLLFESLRTHLKFQLQSYFNTIVEIIMSDNTKNIYEIKEITNLALENVAQMWRIPGLCTELYLNYDCDIYCSNLFEDITKLLSKSIVASGNNHYYELILDAMITVIESIEYNCQMKSDLKELEAVEDVHDDNKKFVAIDIDNCDGNDDSTVHDIREYISFGMGNRHKISPNLPTVEQLIELKNKKRWIATGTEHFNQKPEKGIEFLQEHGILSTPLDPLEIANFLKHNPGLDKKQIGEYITKKKNVESRILATYAASFDMKELRIDQALRLYLETFRLPGEAPLIFLVMEHFAEHWHNCNGLPFANTDAAFRLAYAVIMLNMDQHNHNAKKLNIPMTIDDFVRNLRGCNGTNDFDKKMLEAVFNAIKNEEIVMPAEHIGIVKENYMWKVLLRQGATKDGEYMHCPIGAYDLQLFMVTWGPMVAALSSIFDKSSDPLLYTQALEGFDKCATIVGHSLLTNELDTIILSLCKFSGLLNLPEQMQHISIGTALGQTYKAQLALKKVFGVCHRHANSIREGWKPILEIVLALFKGHLLPKYLTEADDFCSPTGKISLIHESLQASKAQDAGLLSSIYSYIALSSESNSMRNPNPDELELIEIATECVTQCNIDTLLLVDSKFLQLESLQELVKYLILAGKPVENQIIVKPSYCEDPIIFFLELLIKIIIQNRDRVSNIWSATEMHLVELMKMAADSTQLSLSDKNIHNNSDNVVNRFSSNLLERSSTGLLRLAINLMRSEECASEVLHSLSSFLTLSYPVYHHIASQIAIGLFELVKTSAQNIHSAEDWSLVFKLLETTGAGAMHLKQDEIVTGSKSDGAVSSEEESISTDRGYTSEGELSQSPPSQGWILVKNETDGGANVSQGVQTGINPLLHPCALRPHDPNALLKCWECLAFIVRDVAHITPYNFESCVNCIRTFVEASLNGSNQYKITIPSNASSNKDKRKRSVNYSKHIQKSQSEKSKTSVVQNDNIPEGYQLISIQLLDLMHTLHSRTAQIFKWWREEANYTGNASAHDANLQANTGVEWCNLWNLAWQPLLQGIARLCTDNRRQVSNSAVTYLQRALLVHDLQTLSGEEWEMCFHYVLFPLLSRLTEHHDDIRLRANTIMCKVFLHHLTPLLGRPSFSNLWLSLLDLMRSLMTGSHTTDLLYEATLESLKNMLLVMDSVKVFNDGDGYSELWNITWDRINSFLPKLKTELFKPPIHNEKSKDTMEPVQPQLANQNVPTSPQSSTTFGSNISTGNVAGNISTSSIINSQNQILNNPLITSQIRGSSIILQPPNVGSQVHSPLFTHLGQMVSTPIGIAPAMTSATNMQTYPILCPNPLPVKNYNQQYSTEASQLPHENSKLSNASYTSIQNVPKSEIIEITSHSSDKVYQSNVIQQPILTNISNDVRFVNEDQQPRSLYGEYITNPYNPLLHGPVDNSILKTSSMTEDSEINRNINISIPDTNSAISNDCDLNLNQHASTDASHTPHIQKSQSVTSSPLRSPGKINSSFGSSDNIKYGSTLENPADSGIFSFSKYFYTDPTNIPPGSEILFGGTSN